jgi:hypothetical protein
LAAILQDAWQADMLLLQVLTVFLVSVAMALALAHALEFPGKMRLSKDIYIATQSIYYPGFTIGGFGEGLGLLATLSLVLLMPRGTLAFWWSLAGFLALVITQVVFWTVTQPVNRHWVAGLRLTGAAQRFFSVDPTRQQGAVQVSEQDQWEHLRDRWEYSHIVRAVFAAISLISVTVAIAVYGRS